MTGVQTCALPIYNVYNILASFSSINEEQAKQIKQLKHHAEEVSQFIHTIKKLSDSIGLLALNAFIEAARAGENEKGFTVIADRIRKLAIETKFSANRITESILNMNNCVDDTIKVIEKGKIQVHEGQTSLYSMSSLFEELFESITQTKKIRSEERRVG